MTDYKLSFPFLLPRAGRMLKRFPLAAAAAITFLLPACSDDPKPAPDPDPSEDATSILLYAVASNNLHYDLQDDLAELYSGMEQSKPGEADVWIYSLDLKELPSLRHVVRQSDGSYSSTVVKQYDRSQYSTAPERISQVISDYTTLSDASQRGIIFWSHATGWQPDFNDHVVPADSENHRPQSTDNAGQVNYSYGSDQYLGTTDSCDIIELNEAIPSGTFDFIWFDCCYMSSIEVLYQLRDKAAHIVAYPTEVASEGMPYNLTIPYLARRDYDLTGAASAMSQYFLDRGQVVTIAVIDTSHLPELARLAETAVGGQRLSLVKLQRYSRSPNGPFLDFGQYTRTWGANRPDAGWDEAAFTRALDATVIYKAASDYGFDGRAILPENFSGISCHYFYDDESEKAEYYKKLDWFKAVYPRYTED